MLSKVITWGDDRQETIRKMVRALQDTVILGVTTNLPYLIDILLHPDFGAGKISTKFLQESMEPWRPRPDTTNSTWLALAAFEAIGDLNSSYSRSNSPETDHPFDPWHEQSGWRNVSI
jgi:acetyl/propionyl-CoA carboxylase alpha subunit